MMMMIKMMIIIIIIIIITIIPIIVGSLECVKRNLDKAVKDLSIEGECCNHTSSAYILRRFSIC